MGAMPAARVGDLSTKKTDAIVIGSPDVLTESSPQARMGDLLAPNGMAVLKGSATVFVNGKKAARVNDPTGCPDTIGNGASKTFIGDGGGGPDALEGCFGAAASSGSGTISAG